MRSVFAKMKSSVTNVTLLIITDSSKYCKINLFMLRSSINIQCIQRSVAHRRGKIFGKKKGVVAELFMAKNPPQQSFQNIKKRTLGGKNGYYTWMLLCNTQSFLNRDCQWLGNPSLLNQGLWLNNNHPNECYMCMPIHLF